MVGYSLIVFEFCYLLRFITISSVHGAFSLSINAHAQSMGTEKFLLSRSLENFDTRIVKRLRKFQYWAKRTVLEKKGVFIFILVYKINEVFAIVASFTFVGSLL